MASSLMFYQNPIPLEKDKHAKLKMKKIEGLGFASGANSVPVAGIEFFACSRHHPVMFVKSKDEKFVPIAVLSLEAKGHNLGDTWGGMYVPSYVRRYPFVLEEKNGLVMFDEASPFLQEDEGEPLFGDDGEPSTVLNEIIGFLQHVDRSFKMTEAYISALQEKDLLQPCKNTIKFTDNTLKLDNLYVVEEKAFVESLSDEEIADWFKKGWIAWTYAHISSINAIPDVVRRLPLDAPEAATEEA